MEQINIKLTPTNPNNPTITRVTTNPQLVIKDLEHDTYQLDVTSAVYKPYSKQIFFSGDSTFDIHLESLVDEVTEWRAKSNVTTIPITTVYTDDSTLDIGVEQVTIEGTIGKIIETWEAEYINNVPTGQIRNQNTTTVPMVQRKVRRGTKVPSVVLTDVLTQSNATVTYATNTYVDDVRTPSDAVPMGGATFEIRQWDNPTGALNVSDGDLMPNAPYTLAVELENVGTAIEVAKFVIGISYFGGKHIFNGLEVSIPPSMGEYNFKPHMPNSGKVEYLYQFTTEPGTPDGDFFQFNFDNAANNTKVRMSKLGLYEGHVDPFGGG